MASFSRMPAAAVLDPTLPDAARHVLSVLAIFADENGSAWPSIPTIAVGAGMSQRTVQRHMRRLEADGYIITKKVRRTDGGWDRNAYQITYREVDVVRLVTARVTPGGSNRGGDIQSDTRDAANAGPGDNSEGALVTKSAGLVTAKVSVEQPISNQPKEQPTARAGARDTTTWGDVKEKLAALKANDEADRDATMQRLAQQNAELAARMQR